MTCPTCHRSNRDFVNSSGLLTRCDDAWHIGRDFLAETLATTPLPRHWLAEADSSASPARPDDFATQTPPAPRFPTPSHHGAAEAFLGHPYTTPVPEPTTNGANGWVYCEACDAPQPTSGHECAPPEWIDPKDRWPHAVECRAFRAFAAYPKLCEGCGWGLEAHAEARAEFAESLLCASALNHGIVLGTGGRCGNLSDFGWCLWCDAERAYDAARGGGR